jgi:hypothetical protein
MQQAGGGHGADAACEDGTEFDSESLAADMLDQNKIPRTNFLCSYKR